MSYLHITLSLPISEEQKAAMEKAYNDDDLDFVDWNKVCLDVIMEAFSEVKDVREIISDWWPAWD